VALNLGISPKTVYLHRDTLRAKFGVRSDFDLRRVALECGLLP
jgi:DNA-binding CsgD family transcriptional regulator